MPSADVSLIHALAKNAELVVQVWKLRQELRFERRQKLHAQKKRGMQRSSRAMRNRANMLANQAMRRLQSTAVRGLRRRTKAATKGHRGGEQPHCDGLSEPQSQPVETQAIQERSNTIVMDSVSLMEKSVHVTEGYEKNMCSRDEDAGDEPNMWEELLEQWFPDEEKSSSSSSCNSSA